MLILNITDPPSFITIQLYGLPANIICTQCLCSLINSDLVKTEYLIYRSRERIQEVCLDLGPCPVSCSGTYWSNWWLMTLAISSGAKWIRSLTQWAQERDGPPPAPGSRLVASCQAALSPGSFFFLWGSGGLLSFNLIQYDNYPVMMIIQYYQHSLISLV